MRIMAPAAIAVVAALAMSAAGCAASSRGPAGPSRGPAASSRGPAASSRPPSAVARLCGPPDAQGRLITVRAADGMRLAAIETGAGGRGVVLIPEHGAAGKCGWWEFAAYLAAHGYHVLLFDHRCTGQSGCGPGAGGTGLMSDIRAAVARLRQDGAARVALVGASQGGSEALIAGTEPALDVTGLVALSADELTVPLARPPDPATALAAVPRLRRPVLFAVAASDPYVSVRETRTLVARTGSRSKHLVVVGAGAGHGWDLVAPSRPGGAPRRLSQTVLAFLRDVTS
jgi:pimeloyl-ACP methyl ester carboxylesterase